MGEGKRGVANPDFDLDPPLEFRGPSWFRDFDDRLGRFPGQICWYHEEICEVVARDMRVLRRQSQPQTGEEVEKEEEEIRKEKEGKDKKRQKKIDEIWEEKQKEEEEKRKAKMMRLMEHEWMREWMQKEEVAKEEVVKEERPEWKLASLDVSHNSWAIDEMGEPYDLSLLLSGGRRTNSTHLINNKGGRVDVSELLRKYVLLYLWSLPGDCGSNHYSPDPEFNADLEEIYNLHRKDFEVVFVALGNNEDVFRETFSPMPWLAIEHGEQEARNYFITMFSIPHPTICERAVLFDPDGRVVFANAAPIIDTYGVHGFPYTREKIDSLVAECRTLRRGLFLEQIIPPLTELLGANAISKDEKKVPTSVLEGKTVGLYFFEPTFEGFERTSQLLKIWNSLEDYQRNDFVVVLVNKSPFNLSIALGGLEKKFNYAMPFYSIESCGRKLCQVFRKECRSNTDEAGDLIVLRPDKYQPLSYFAFKILEEYGTAAYPFTLERAVELRKKEQQNQRVLSEFLSPEAPLRRGGSARLKEDSDTTVSKLFGKRVLLLFGTHCCYDAGSFLLGLKRTYEEKGTDADFEIIYISLDCDESPSSFPKSVQCMPWLVHALVPDFAADLARKVFDELPRLPAIAAFGPSGHLETKESNLAFKNNSNSEYPFIKADMDDEVSRELIYTYKWGLEGLLASKGFL